MNTHISYYSHADIASMGVPWGYRQDVDPYGAPCWAEIEGDDAIKADSLDRLERLFLGALRSGDIGRSDMGRFDSKHQGVRLDAAYPTIARDASEVFWTNSLEQVLASIVRQPKTSNVMTGPTAMLPVMATLRPGQLAGVYDVESTTGQAAHVEPDGARKLPVVGEWSERMRYTSGFIGIGYNIGLAEMWRAAEMGKPLEQMRRMTAESALQRFSERILLYGDAGHEYLGILQNSHAYLQGLDKKFSTATVEEAQILLQIMEKCFKVIGESYAADAPITGVIAPKEDLRYLQRLRWDNDTAALPDFMEMHSWLKNVRWIEHIEGSGPNSGSQWVFWSDDPNELWSELNPVPMLFGPWQDSNTGLRKSWAMLQQIGGVINRRRERVVKFEQTT